MRNEGFSLIELLVTIAIVSLLSVIILGGLGDIRQRARDTSRLAQSKQISQAIQLYINDHGEPPLLETINNSYVNSCGTPDWETLQELLESYVSSIPNDPLNADGYCYSYSPAPDEMTLPANTECELERATFFFKTEKQTFDQLPEWSQGLNPPIYCVQ